MSDFKALLTDGRIHIFDGGYGTLLMRRGLPPGVSPEVWGMERPDVVAGAHRDYVMAGAEVLTTNTFGGSRPKLPAGCDVARLNRAMVELARSVAGDACCVAASIGPTGYFVRPLGPLSFVELVEIYKEQIRACAQGGADLILGETHFDLAEAKAVAVAAHEVCDLPVAVSMTFEQNRCLTGTDPLAFVDTMRNLGVDMVCTNCSAGPEQIALAVEAMQPRLDLPLYVAANAGLPELDAEGNTVFRLGAVDFAEQSARFVDLGAKFIGGCCGTGPDHVRALSGRLAGTAWRRPKPTDHAAVVLTSRTRRVGLGGSHPCAIIGERINPTGKAELTRQLQAGEYAEALRLGAEQEAHGASLLDVNVGAAMVDEAVLLPGLVTELLGRVQAPLCVDTSSLPAALTTLPLLPGSGLFNSISGEPERLEKLGPVCKRYGLPFILLPLLGRKLPVTAAQRLEVVERLLVKAESLGIPRRLIVVDVLALTVSSKPEAAKACLETIRHCHEKWGLATAIGLSNVSFGLPARELLNSTFLSMGMGAGLSACIANPGSVRLRESLAAGKVLLDCDPKAQAFIAGYADWKAGGAATANSVTTVKNMDSAAGGKATANGHDPLAAAVLNGDTHGIAGLVRTAIEGGAGPFTLVNDRLIPAIMEVGERYERREYFLPQLIASAEALQNAFAVLRPLLQQGGARPGPAVVMATVQGDIHDIGKNIVCLILRNHGFEVTDLGKDVPAGRIVDEAERLGARIIGLSALMTTTMVRMEDTVRLVRERGLNIRVMLGGAVVTQSFADAIGADGYASDAIAAVRLAQRLIE